MSNAGTSILWSSAPCRDLSMVRREPPPVWSYYARVSIASPHCRIASEDFLESMSAKDAEFPAKGSASRGPESLPKSEPASGSFRNSEIREWGPWSLTQRELEVLQLLTEGATNSEISQRLFISPKTAKNHLAAIFQKLDVTNRTHALVRAVVMGLVNIE
jgi:DNA-binding CsgD family transcriptional regulator